MQVSELRIIVAEGRYEVDSAKVASAIVEKLRAIGVARDAMRRSTGVHGQNGPPRAA